MAIRDYGNYWLIVNPCTSYLMIELVSKEDFPDLPSLSDESATFMDVSVQVDDDYIYSRISLSTCVDTAKRLLGIKRLFLFTPYQLFKYLRKHNGR